VLVELVSVRTGDAENRALERDIVEGVDLAATSADEVVVMQPARQRRFEARDALAEIDSVHQAELGQLLEHAVDACETYRAPLGPQAVEELLRRDAAVLGCEIRDDRVAGSAGSRPGAAELVSRMPLPGGLISFRHGENDIDSHDVLLSGPAMRAGIVLTFVLLAAAACGGSDEGGSGEHVIAAFYPIAYAAERLSPGAEVENLTPAGAEPHDLELSPREVEDIAAADVVLYFEGFMPALDDAVDDHEGAVDLLAGLQLLPAAEAHAHGDESGEEQTEEAERDPHVWLDPLRYAAIARKIGVALEEPGAVGKLTAGLRALDREYRSGLATCERRQIVTSHAAFGYLADAYDLEQTPLTGVSPEAEPSARAIEELVEEVREEGATTVFFETLVSPRLAETVAREAGAEVAVLNPLEGLTEDEIEDGADYFSIMRENLAALRKALGCK
jgi:zinc transport system substrate-binding protein